MLQNWVVEKILELGQLMRGGHQDWHAWSQESENSVLSTQHTSKESLVARILSSEDPKVQESFSGSELRAEGIFLMLAGKISLLSY